MQALGTRVKGFRPSPRRPLRRRRTRLRLRRGGFKRKDLHENRSRCAHNSAQILTALGAWRGTNLNVSERLDELLLAELLYVTI